MFSKLFFGAIVVIAGVYLQGSYCFKLSQKYMDDVQANAIQDFRTAVENDLPHEYMREDYYLLRFLSPNDFNVGEATNSLKEHLKWREAEKIDTILEEDWTDYEARFPYKLTENKDGRPVLYYNYGAFDIAKEAKSKDFDRFKRYFTAKMLEDADRKVRESNSHRQFDIVINMKGLGADKQGCIPCIELYNDLIKYSKDRHTGAVKDVFILYAPNIFQRFTISIAKGMWIFQFIDTIMFLAGVKGYEPFITEHIDWDKFPVDL